jgi:hypothetical protein
MRCRASEVEAPDMGCGSKRGAPSARGRTLRRLMSVDCSSDAEEKGASTTGALAVEMRLWR